MQIIALHDRIQIAAALGRHPARHIYELGDLDDFFWPHTTWYGLADAGALSEVALLYYPGDGLPVLLLNPNEPADHAAELLRLLVPLLPRQLYAHLHPETLAPLAGSYTVTSHGAHRKLALVAPQAVAGPPDPAIVALGPADLPAIQALYAASYPGNWFDPRMLLTDCYYGLEQDGALAAIAGVHVVSRAYAVAALGNVTTHPAWRGRGLAQRVCAALCRALLAQGIATIGLNVRADNAAALAAYRKLGFVPVAEYGEYTLTAG